MVIRSGGVNDLSGVGAIMYVFYNCCSSRGDDVDVFLCSVGCLMLCDLFVSMSLAAATVRRKFVCDGIWNREYAGSCELPAGWLLAFNMAGVAQGTSIRSPAIRQTVSIAYVLNLTLE